jgi:DNA/RNA-binding domain of Phe-tRNA-synthetase-like protein
VAIQQTVPAGANSRRYSSTQGVRHGNKVKNTQRDLLAVKAQVEKVRAETLDVAMAALKGSVQVSDDDIEDTPTGA